MKSGEVWQSKLAEGCYVKIVSMNEEFFLDNKEEWICFDYCDETGDIGEDEYQHGDTLPRYQFIQQFKRMYS